MKKITQEEISELEFIGKRQHKSGIIKECSKLEVGESLFISKDEWLSYGYKVKPGQLITSSIFQNRDDHKSKIYGMKFSILSYKEGWVATRIK